MQVQQLENDLSSEECDPLETLNQLQEELHVLENARAEIRELGRNLVQQGTSDMEVQLNDYIQNEDEVLLKLAQMQVRLAQREQDRQKTAEALANATQNISMSDSGVYSYAVEPDGIQKSASILEESAISTVIPEIKEIPSETPRRSSTSVGTTVKPETAPTSERLAPIATKQRTYADAAKIEMTPRTSSPIKGTSPPLVTVKSDTQRHLELALDEWRQRLARLDHLIKTSISTEPSPEAANEIVSFFLLICWFINHLKYSRTSRPEW